LSPQCLDRWILGRGFGPLPWNKIRLY
jgi:hypothetical protein